MNLYDERPEDVARLRGMLEAWLAAHPPEGDAGLSDEQREILRGLGYTGDDLGD